MAKTRAFIGDTATTTVIPAEEAKARGWPFGEGDAVMVTPEDLEGLSEGTKKKLKDAIIAEETKFVAPPLPPAEELKKADEAKVSAPRKPRAATVPAPKAAAGMEVLGLVVSDFLGAVDVVKVSDRRHMESALAEVELRIKVIRTVLGTA